LEFSLTHGAVEAVLERLIFKVELDVVLVGTVADCDVEVHLDGAFRDRTQLVWLAKLDVVPVERQEVSGPSETYWSTLPYSWPSWT